MNSTLSPREIQARIRAGESLDDVAQAAGAPVEKVEPFAAPVLAERAHLAGVALTRPLRRAGEPSSARSLRQVVTEAFVTAGIDPDEVEWDAYQLPDKRWIVHATFTREGESTVAEFRYDKLARYSVAHNDAARSLTGELPAAGSRGGDPDHEPTVDFTDEFAIVRAVGVEPTAPAEAPAPIPSAAATSNATPSDPADVEPTADDYPAPDLDGADAWAEPALEQVDGVYDIVPGKGELDALYDMFNAFAEDSVEIYPGLGEVRPVGAAAPAPSPGEGPVGSPTPASGAQAPNPAPAAAQTLAPSGLSRRQRKRLQAEQRRQQQALASAQPAEPEQLSLEDAAVEAPEPDLAAEIVVPEPAVPADALDEPMAPTAPEPDAGTEALAAMVDEPVELDPPVAPTANEPAADVESHEPQRQESVEEQPTPSSGELGTGQGPAPTQDPEPEMTVALPRGRRAPARKKRATVPSWDEIMFGGPKQM